MKESSLPILLPTICAHSFANHLCQFRVCAQIINARVGFTPSKSNGTSCVVMSGAGPRPRWCLESGNAIHSLCDCLVGEGAKSLEEMGISNTARLHYLHAVHKTQFVPQH